MNLRLKLWVPLMIASLCVCTIASAAQGQSNDSKREHVVSLQDLNADAARPSSTRQGDEAALRHLLSTGVGQQALQSAKVDYKQIDKAIGQLSDEDLAKLAQRSRQAESDFAAGFLSPKHLAELILVLVVVIVIIVLV
jgi:hypothetical protein